MSIYPAIAYMDLLTKMFKNKCYTELNYSMDLVFGHSRMANSANSTLDNHHHHIKDSKAKICRGTVGRGWGGNVCCGFVVNHSVGGQ